MLVYSTDTPDVEDQTYYSRYFEDYMFGGKNLFHLISSSSYFCLIALLSDEESRDSIVALYNNMVAIDSHAE